MVLVLVIGVLGYGMVLYIYFMHCIWRTHEGVHGSFMVCDGVRTLMGFGTDGYGPVPLLRKEALVYGRCVQFIEVGKEAIHRA